MNKLTDEEIDKLVCAYLSGASIPDLDLLFPISRSTIRQALINRGVMRTPDQAREIGKSLNKYANPNKGKSRGPMSQEQKDKLSKSKKGKGRGFSVKKDGTVQMTMGENVHRSQHVLVMEKRLGRSLKEDECIHHIDRNKSNNNENNLALVTNSGHARLHRFEDKLEGKQRKRDNRGRFENEWC